MPRAASPRSIDTQIARRVLLRSARGTVFTPATFTALGSRAAIDKALQRLVRDLAQDESTPARKKPTRKTSA